MNETISTTKAPAAIGPYSQGVKAGNFIYVSGQLPINVKTKEFVSKDSVKEQTEQSIKNIKAILNKAGYELTNVIKTTVFLSDMSNFKDMNEIYAKYFKGNCPARAAFEVAKLPLDALVEIEAVAYKD